jgi:hypothetical protein
MTMPADPQQKIEAYLVRLRQLLHGMNSEDVREIIEELRSHIADKSAISGQVTAAGVDAALTLLGTPEELATQYTTDALLARAEVSRSPVRILDSLFRWASLSVAGFLVLLMSIMGYFLGSVLTLCAVLKTIHPNTAGLWILPNGADTEISLRLGFGSPPLDGRDLLGWWIVPVGLVVGCGLIVLTTRFALWCAGQYRSSLALPRISIRQSRFEEKTHE